MSLLLRCFSLLSLALWIAPAQAQEEPPAEPIEQKGAVVVLEAVADGEPGVPPVVQSFSFQVADGAGFALPMVFGSGGPFEDPTADPSTLLSDRQIQKELELIDAQVQDVQRIQREFGEKQRALMKSMIAPSPDGGRAIQNSAEMGRIQAAMDDLRKERRAQLEQVMLPHQRERLQQLGYHMSMQRQGVADSLTGGPLADELGLSDEQKEKLRETAERLQQELREEIARLRAKAKKELFAELTPAQQEKLQQLVGDDFQYEEEDQQAGLRRLRERMQRSGASRRP